MSKGITAILHQMLAREPESYNTDWDGTLAITALLGWGDVLGDEKFAHYGKIWFEHHRDNLHLLTDEQYYASFTGIHSKIIRKGPIPFSAYCSHWGIVYPLKKISELVKDGTPQKVAEAVADYILHTAARSKHGCAYHDDYVDFIIPDTCYFVAPVMAIAAHLTGKEVYLEHSIHQLKAYIALMQDPQTGLAHTLWNASGMPRNFWTRASGWLAGAYMNTLPYIPKEHSDYGVVVESFQKLAAGILKVQRSDGGFHVLLDRPDTPVECTGAAMLGLALHKGVRNGILDRSAGAAAKAAWEAALRHVSDDGRIRGAYTSWAKPAVQEQFGPNDFDQPRDFVLGLMLLAGAELYEKEQEVLV